MGAQRIATNLISYPFDHEDPNLEPLPGEEGQNGYTALSAGVWQDLNANMQCLFDDAELSFGDDMLYLQSIGEESIVFDDGEGGEISEPTELDPTLACEQSLYWANVGGVNCATVELIYFYHPDYLGSVEFVTDMRGEPYQFFLNTPWGENIENQFARNYTAFSSRFRFNGKEWDEETGNFYYGARYYDPKVSIWLSVDPLAGEAPHLTPYRFSFNNPLNVVDPNGLFEDNFVFDENGDFLRIEENEEPDRLVIENQETCERIEKKFADPVNDPQQIRDGIITKVLFVGTTDIAAILDSKEAFNQESTDNKTSYMEKGGRGGQGLDYSYSAIPDWYKNEGASKDPLNSPSPILFIPQGDDYAHNHMNFGNFLLAATGYTVGFSLLQIQLGAHLNSIFGRGNGYLPQLDSSDDQLSIRQGVEHAKTYQFRKKVK